MYLIPSLVVMKFTKILPANMLALKIHQNIPLPQFCTMQHSFNNIIVIVWYPCYYIRQRDAMLMTRVPYK